MLIYIYNHLKKGGIIMKNFELKKKLALLVCTIAMSIAATSTSLCMFWYLDEIKMPESLYKLD